MNWETPSFTVLSTGAEIGGYQNDFDPVCTQGAVVPVAVPESPDGAAED
jgi:hypothetical protein